MSLLTARFRSPIASSYNAEWHAFERRAAAFLLALATTVILMPEFSFAGSGEPSVVSGVNYLGTQFEAIVIFARTVVLGLAILYALWEGVKAFRGDTGGWIKMASGFLVAFIAYNPNWLIRALFGVNIGGNYMRPLTGS